MNRKHFIITISRISAGACLPSMVTGAAFFDPHESPFAWRLQPIGRALEMEGFERTQLLFKNGKPAYLFTASHGGKYMTASSFIFKIV